MTAKRSRSLPYRHPDHPFGCSDAKQGSTLIGLHKNWLYTGVCLPDEYLYIHSRFQRKYRQRGKSLKGMCRLIFAFLSILSYRGDMRPKVYCFGFFFEIRTIHTTLSPDFSPWKDDSKPKGALPFEPPLQNVLKPQSSLKHPLSLILRKFSFRGGVDGYRLFERF